MENSILERLEKIILDYIRFAVFIMRYITTWNKSSCIICDQRIYTHGAPGGQCQPCNKTHRCFTIERHINNDMQESRFLALWKKNNSLTVSMLQKGFRYKWYLEKDITLWYNSNE